jgi:vacuolar protein sorting-associated protein 54
MKSDVEYLITRLGKVEGFGDVGDRLLAVIKSKKSAQIPVKSTAEEKPEEKNNDNKETRTENTVDDGARKTSTDETSPK